MYWMQLVLGVTVKVSVYSHTQALHEDVQTVSNNTYLQGRDLTVSYNHIPHL